MAPEKCALGEQSDGGTPMKRLWGGGRLGENPDGSSGWHSVRPSPLDDVGLSTHTAETTWNVDLIFWIFAEPQQFHEAGKPVEKASVCRHILKAGAALISWESWCDLASPQDTDSHQPVYSLDLCGQEQPIWPCLQNLGRVRPGAARWRSMPLWELHVTLRQRMLVALCSVMSCTRVTVFQEEAEVLQRIAGWDGERWRWYRRWGGKLVFLLSKLP